MCIVLREHRQEVTYSINTWGKKIRTFPKEAIILGDFLKMSKEFSRWRSLKAIS